jgi:hypothetical protein
MIDRRSFLRRAVAGLAALRFRPAANRPAAASKWRRYAVRNRVTTGTYHFADPIPFTVSEADGTIVRDWDDATVSRWVWPADGR